VVVTLLVAVLITETLLLPEFGIYAFCADASVQVSAKATANSNGRIEFGTRMNSFSLFHLILK
jgi:hypothetical protein